MIECLNVWELALYTRKTILKEKNSERVRNVHSPKKWRYQFESNYWSEWRLKKKIQFKWRKILWNAKKLEAKEVKYKRRNVRIKVKKARRNLKVLPLTCYPPLYLPNTSGHLNRRAYSSGNSHLARVAINLPFSAFFFCCSLAFFWRFYSWLQFISSVVV